MNSFFLSDFLILSEDITYICPFLYWRLRTGEIQRKQSILFLCLIRIRRLNSIKIIRSSDQKLIIFIRTHVNCLIKFKKDFSLNKKNAIDEIIFIAVQYIQYLAIRKSNVISYFCIILKL